MRGLLPGRVFPVTAAEAQNPWAPRIAEGHRVVRAIERASCSVVLTVGRQSRVVGKRQIISDVRVGVVVFLGKVMAAEIFIETPEQARFTVRGGRIVLRLLVDDDLGRARGNLIVESPVLMDSLAGDVAEYFVFDDRPAKRGGVIPAKQLRHAEGIVRTIECAAAVKGGSEPMNVLVPDFVITFTTPPEAWPNSAEYPLVST